MALLPTPTPALYKNAPWLLGTLGAIVFFAIFESYAFNHPDSANTLSHFISSIGASWPLSIWLMGLFCGILGSHFFWPWQENPLGKGKG